ncbi:MAG: Ldh family oxidoreductase, partial [Clostridia bacterium]|nr:Ldh family oxidoreductase [Clostridia bacterium]
MAEHYLAVDGVRAYCEEIFRRHGFDDDACRQIVDVVLTADLYGIESHGIQRMQRYHDSLRRKLVDVNARPDVVYETPLSA